MKNTNLITVVVIAILFVSCKENEAKKEALINEAIEETTVDVVPRKSDTYFSDALASIKADDKQVASKQIIQGVDALLEEGKDVSGLYKLNLDMAIDQLRDIAGKLEDNFDVSEQGFKEAVANAEINIAHNYLATDDVFVLTPKENVKDSRFHQVFNMNLKNLEAGTSKLKDDAKKEGEKLTIEGEKLKKEYEDWKKRAEEHVKKTESHFKEHQPEYVYPLGVFPLF
ncbi:hypothetical protein [Bizionia arctica]|uniref:Lipoprotein n=1 Tax=Bizionia arctica TaxID=1495645 RepID=A0A917GKB9_9FLAO|nr:hypothetical protein [Bizionia arctica]GGG49067.1 hypothetical protein GCM10010976_20500 [Bizionia arctica]